MPRNQVGWRLRGRSPVEIVDDVGEWPVAIHDSCCEVDVDDEASDDRTDRLKDPAPNFKPTSDVPAVILAVERPPSVWVVQVWVCADGDVVGLLMGVYYMELAWIHGR